MNLKVKVDPESMGKYIKNGGELLFEIAWEDKGKYYPMNPWLDFGMVILGWWSNSMSSALISKESVVEFSFMDGPYNLRMEIDWLTNQVVILSENGKFKAQSSISEVKQQLISAIELIDNELSTHSLLSNDRERLANFKKLLTA